MRNSKTRRNLFVSIGAFSLIFVFSTLSQTSASAVTAGVCSITPNYPHPSTHVNGTINGQATVQCTMPVPKIVAIPTLERSDGKTYPGTPSTVFMKYGTKVNAAAPCSEYRGGNFRMRVEFYIDSPAGYTPAYIHASAYSKWVPVACGVAYSVPKYEIQKMIEYK